MPRPPAARREDEVDLKLTTHIYRNGVPVSRDKSFDIVRPGESLTGHVQISSEFPIHLDKVEFNIQGIESKLKYLPTLNAFEPRTIAIKPGIVKVHPSQPARNHEVDYADPFQFLHMRHWSDISDVQQAAGHDVFDATVPFVFVLPDGIERVDEDETSSCRRYPPSFRLRNTEYSSWSHLPPPTSFITYALWCSLTYSVQTNQGQLVRTTDTMKAIEYMPALETQPPIDASGSGDSYELTAEQPISRAYLGQRLGHVRVQTAEPKPLEYTGSTASTTCHFQLSFRSTRSNMQQCPIKGIVVYTVLVARHYQSVAKLTAMPTRALASEYGPLQMYEDTINLGKSRSRDVLWELETGNDGQGSADGETSGVWRTTLAVNVSPPLRLSPSFLSDYTTMSYSLTFSAQFEGVGSKTMFLTCPLQVAYPLQTEIPAAAPMPSPDAIGNTEQASPDAPCCSMSVAGSEMNESLPPYAK